MSDEMRPIEEPPASPSSEPAGPEATPSLDQATPPPPPETADPLDASDHARLAAEDPGRSRETDAHSQESPPASSSDTPPQEETPPPPPFGELPPPTPEKVLSAFTERGPDRTRTFTKGTRVWCLRNPMVDGTVEKIVESALVAGHVGIVVRWDEPLWTPPTPEEVEREVSRILEQSSHGFTREALVAMFAADPHVTGHAPFTLRLADEPVPPINVKVGDPVRLIGQPATDGVAYEVTRRSDRRGDVHVRVTWNVRPREELPDSPMDDTAERGTYCYLELER